MSKAKAHAAHVYAHLPVNRLEGGQQCGGLLQGREHHYHRRGRTRRGRHGTRGGQRLVPCSSDTAVAAVSTCRWPRCKPRWRIWGQVDARHRQRRFRSRLLRCVRAVPDRCRAAYRCWCRGGWGGEARDSCLGGRCRQRWLSRHQLISKVLQAPFCQGIVAR